MLTELQVIIRLAEKIAEERAKLFEEISDNEKLLKKLNADLVANEAETKLIGASLKKLSLKLGLVSRVELRKMLEFQDIIESIKELDAKRNSNELPQNVISLPRRDDRIDENDSVFKVVVNDSDENDRDTDTERSLESAVEEVLSTLTGRERVLLSLRFGIHDYRLEKGYENYFMPESSSSCEILDDSKKYAMTYEWIAAQVKGSFSSTNKSYPMTRQTASKHILKALRKIKHPVRFKIIENYNSGNVTCGEERLLYALQL